MSAEIGMKELIVIVLCFVLYVVAIEMYEVRIDTMRQGELARQEQSFTYAPDEPAHPVEGASTVTDTDQ